MSPVHSNRSIKKRTYRRYKMICNGFVTWNNKTCPLFMLQRRPGISSTALEKQTCVGCNGDLGHRTTYKAYAFYFSGGSTCTLEHHGEHNHNQINDNDNKL